MALMVSASAAISPFASSDELLRQVAVGDRGHDLDDAAHLARSGCEAMKFTLSVRSFQVPDDARDLGLAAELAFGADFAWRRA